MATIKSEAAPEIMEQMLLIINHKMKNLLVMEEMQQVANLQTMKN